MDWIGFIKINIPTQYSEDKELIKVDKIGTGFLRLTRKVIVDLWNNSEKYFDNNIEKANIPSINKTLLKRLYREELKLQLPGFQADEYGMIAPPATKDIFNEMKTKWRANPAIMEYEAAQGFAEAMTYWEDVEALSKEYSPTQNPDWWLTPDDVKAKGLRLWMYNKANLVIEKYPEFWPVWTGVMLKLYRDDQEYLDYLPEG